MTHLPHFATAPLPPDPVAAEERELSFSGAPMPPDGIEGCVYCGAPFKPGDMVMPERDGGEAHVACMGTDRDGFYGADGEPLKDGEPIPTGYPWKSFDDTKAEALAREIAAEKIGSSDPTGARLPDDIWRQALPEARRRLGLATPATKAETPGPAEGAR